MPRYHVVIAYEVKADNVEQVVKTANQGNGLPGGWLREVKELVDE